MVSYNNSADYQVTQYNIITGGASNILNNVAPSATAGVPVISQGSSAQPIFGTCLVAGGGTGIATTTAYGVLCGGTTATGAFQNAGAGLSGQILRSGGASALPAYSTATYPATASGAGTLLRADGTNWSATTTTYPNTNAISTLLYASAANVMSALTTANNGLLVTSATGVPSILAGPGTTGQVLQANAAAAPSFSTATYPSTATSTGTILRADGTNWSATTATYPATTTSQQILYSSAANVVGGLATGNSLLAATNASGTLAMRAFSVVTQVFTSSGTYTPTAGMLYCKIECLGGGGAGGGAAATGAGTGSCGGGGGAGEYASGVFSASTIGASKSVTIGAAGTANSGATGGNGGATSVGSTNISANGGSGGATAGASAITNISGGAGGTGGTGGDFRTNGSYGGYSFIVSPTAGPGLCQPGASSQYGAGGAGIAGSNSAGSAGSGYGAGGGGAMNLASQTAVAGGAGTKGVVIITEYVIA